MPPGDSDDHSWEEEEDEEEEEDADFSDDSDDKLGTTNKEMAIKRRLEEEQEEHEETDEEEDEEDEEVGAGPRVFIQGSRVKLAPEHVVRAAVGEHWNEYMGYCCGRVGVVHRNHSTEHSASPNVFVSFGTQDAPLNGFLSIASFTLPQSILQNADRRRSRANTSTVLASRAITPPHTSLLASTAAPSRKNSR
eukprot:TRINITY_DN2771_c0_g1_i1.p1 TRINITY_DN2771_c0_g1~~TRINITY_DN2771_c0_g1_i1.p1  ORF type:complete len:193 (+),score=36.29 TRINITY_DN2771_c0_g1_i1:311-889(+)